MKILSFCLSLFFISPVVLADDLLSILEGKDSSSGLIQETSELEQLLRKELKNVTAEQNIFLDFVVKDQYEKALFQWSSAFESTEFSKKPMGVALYSFVLAKNKLPIIAIENLFSVKKVAEIPLLLKQMLRQELPSEHPAWFKAQIEWVKDWTAVFDLNTEIAVLSRKKMDLKKQTEIYELLKLTKLNTTSRAWLEWQMALSLAVNGDVAKSAKVLAHLLKSKNSKVSSNLVYVTAARLLYERGYLDASISYYKKVPKNSEYWFVAQEEMAWAYMRKGQPQDSLAIAKTQMYPYFAPHVGAEMVFLKALAHLKLCDYTGVAKTLDSFKQRYFLRAKELLTIKEQGLTPATEKLVELMKKGKVRLLSLGPEAKKIPRYLTRDEQLKDLVNTLSGLEGEALVAGELYTRSLAGGTAQVGFQAFLEQFKQSVQGRVQSAKSAVYSLIKRRAGEELDEINRLLQKMHIIEAELIQQASVVDRVVADSKSSKDFVKKGSTKKAGKYDVVFPFEGETWFDELSNYKIDIDKACKYKKASAK